MRSWWVRARACASAPLGPLSPLAPARLAGRGGGEGRFDGNSHAGPVNQSCFVRWFTLTLNVNVKYDGMFGALMHTRLAGEGGGALVEVERLYNNIYII